MTEMTIRELANALGVSKTTIRNHMENIPDFREKITLLTPENVLQISESGCEKLSQSIGKPLQTPQSSCEKLPETVQSTEKLITIPESLLDTLQAQLDAKDQQIASLQKNLNNSLESLHNAQESIKAFQTIQYKMLGDDSNSTENNAKSQSDAPNQSRKWYKPWTWKKGS